jgi:hypothetical protein
MSELELPHRELEQCLIEEEIKLGNWSEAKINSILERSQIICDRGERVAYLSQFFLGTPYVPNTMSSSSSPPEKLTINLEGVDCFTMLDYIHAMALSKNYAEFKNNLRKVRYKNGRVDFSSRNHFFSDFAHNNADTVQDITANVGKSFTQEMIKMLNLKKDKHPLINDVNPRVEVVKVIPSIEIPNMMDQLKTGDYVGIYTDTPGLDVSHIGIIIKDPTSGNILLRHASMTAQNMKVVDVDFQKYMMKKKGFVLLRISF